MGSLFKGGLSWFLIQSGETEQELLMRVLWTAMKGVSMSKAKETDELRPEYKREDLGVGVRGKYFKDYSKGTNLVLLSPDVAKLFSSEEAVNEALRSPY